LDIKKHRHMFHSYKWIASEDIEKLREYQPRI